MLFLTCTCHGFEINLGNTDPDWRQTRGHPFAVNNASFGEIKDHGSGTGVGGSEHPVPRTISGPSSLRPLDSTELVLVFFHPAQVCTFFIDENKKGALSFANTQSAELDTLVSQLPLTKVNEPALKLKATQIFCHAQEKVSTTMNVHRPRTKRKLPRSRLAQKARVSSTANGLSLFFREKERVHELF